MKKTVEKSLCSSCRYDPECDLPRVKSIPVEQCEKYEKNGTNKNMKTTGGKGSSRKAVKAAHANPIESLKYE